MIDTILWLTVVLQLALQREAPPLTIQIYGQGKQIGTEPASVVIEITNGAKHSVTLWKSPIFPVFKSEIGSSSEPAASTKPISRLLLVYDCVPVTGRQIVQAEGGTPVPFQQVTLAPGETTYVKATLSRYMVGQRAKIWLEMHEDGAVIRSNKLEVEAASAK